MGGGGGNRGLTCLPGMMIFVEIKAKLLEMFTLTEPYAAVETRLCIVTKFWFGNVPVFFVL